MGKSHKTKNCRQPTHGGRWSYLPRREMNYKQFLYYATILLVVVSFTFIINLHYKTIHHTNIKIWDTLKILIQIYWEKSDNHSPEKPNHIIPVSYHKLSIHKCRIHSAYQQFNPCEERGFTIHVCLRLIHGQMRMNMTRTQYMHFHMLHEWYTTILLPVLSRNETNSCLFSIYRPGTNFQILCQCVTHHIASQNSGFLEDLQHLGDLKVMVCKAEVSHSKLARSYNLHRYIFEFACMLH
jgi:hypothetical protein